MNKRRKFTALLCILMCVALLMSCKKNDTGEGDYELYYVNAKTQALEQEKVLTLPGTGMVQTLGLGEDNDLHPHNKKDVGELLADLAEKMTGTP